MEPIFANTTNLCFVRRGPEVLLIMKKRGFGRGKWNAPGGKVRPGEELEAAVVREVREETGLTPSGIKHQGVIEFVFDGQPLWNNRCHIYSATGFTGDVEESEEGRPAWFPTNGLPFDKMWDDDRHWVPLVLAGKTVSLRFFFNSKGKLTGREEIHQPLPKFRLVLPRLSAKWITAAAAATVFFGGTLFLREFLTVKMPDAFYGGAEQAVIINAQTRALVDQIADELRIMAEQEAAGKWKNAREHAERGVFLSNRFVDLQNSVNQTWEILREQSGGIRPVSLKRNAAEFTSAADELSSGLLNMSQVYNQIFSAYPQEYGRREAGEDPRQITVDVAGARSAANSLTSVLERADSNWQKIKTAIIN